MACAQKVSWKCAMPGSNQRHPACKAKDFFLEPLCCSASEAWVKGAGQILHSAPPSLNKQPPGSISLLPGCVLIQVLLQAGQAAVAADLSDLPQAQSSFVGSGEARAAEGVG